MKKIKHNIIYCLLFFIILTGLTSFFIPTENIQIRIYSHLKINTLQLNVVAGNYKIMADANIISESNGEAVFKLNLKGDSVELRKNDIVQGIYKYIKFVGNSGGELKIKLIDPDRKNRIYQNNLSFSVVDSYVRIINEVVLDSYIAGVTEAEAGIKLTSEFYKVQAILARTFALAHINKHVTEGFSLCDQVHCQVYYGKPRDLNIFKATESTKGKVVVDENLNLITAAFHSNSGGQTANSEDVWGSKTSYLKSIVDSFSTKMPNAKWERRMLTDDWLAYLKLKHHVPTGESQIQEAVVNFKQDSRKVYLECSTSKVPLKNIRLDLQLKSTFFNISPISKDSVLFKGRGYGHGLGMCQEGAMKMAKMGYNHETILNFYYKNIQLIDLSKLSFFKDE
jgi:stage II sporulation protein D